MSAKKSRRTSDVSVMALGFNKSISLPTSNIVDPFDKKYGGGGELAIVAPPYQPSQLLRVPEYSKILMQCIRVMAMNVHGFGWELEKAPHMADVPAGKMPAEAIAEKRLLERIFGNINSDGQNLTLLCQDKRAEREEIGTAYVEVIRNGAGEICELYLLPSYQTRITVKDDNPTEYEQLIRNEDGNYEAVPRLKYFRRFIQIVNGKKVYFKEFGDPRLISRATGKEAKSPGEAASEVIMFRNRCSYSPYGLPRWIGQTLSIMGAHKADQINYSYFDNKAIPPLVVSISGGSLTAASKKKLEEIFEYEVKGINNFHNALILESVPDSVGEIAGEKFSQVRIEVKPLTQFMQKDALFQTYDQNVTRMTGSSFLFPPLYLALSEDYTRATAKEAAQVAETQVFQPERNAFNYRMNATIMADLNINFWTFKLRAPKTTDYAGIVTALSGIKEAMTVGDLQEAGLELMGKPIDGIDEEMYKIPFALLYQGGSLELDNLEGDNLEKAARYIGKFVQKRAELVKMLEDQDQPQTVLTKEDERLIDLIKAGREIRGETQDE